MIMSKPIRVANIGSSFPERRIIVQLTSGKLKDSNGEPLEYFINRNGNDVDVKVRLKRNYGGIDPKASVSILNLNQDTMRKFMTKDFSPTNPDTITVYAGYETVGQKTSEIPFLFTANIIWAIPTTGRPDIWFTISCVENFFGINTGLSVFISNYGDIVANGGFGKGIGDVEGDTFDSINLLFRLVEYFGNYYGFEGNLRTDLFESLKKASPERYEKYQTSLPYSYTGTIGGFLSGEPYAWNRMAANTMNGEIWAVPNSEDMNYLATVFEPSITISASSKYPMIDIPKPNPTGVDLVTLFNRDLLPNVYFNLDSKIFTAWNMVYWIQTVVYDLHLRGKNFYTIIQARR